VEAGYITPCRRAPDGAFVVIDQGVSGRGTDRHVLVLADPPLAAPAPELRVVFTESSWGGWHVQLQSATHVVASFPVLHHAEAHLAESSDPWMPLPDREGFAWEDADQGWCLWICRSGEDVYLFESNHDDLLMLSGVHVAEPMPAPGSVVVGGTESTWSRCELAAFRDAWSAAQTEARRLLAGS